MKRVIYLIALVSLIPISSSWATPVSVYFVPEKAVVGLGDVFTVDLLADIPAPVLGFGVDINFDENVLSLAAPATIGPSWIPALSADGDGLAGLAFPAVFGEEILLASFTFESMALTSAGGTTAYAGMTDGDLSEGFPLAFPSLPGTFSDVVFSYGTVVVPEPPSVSFLLLGLAAISVIRRLGRSARTAVKTE